jgi:RpiR family carbohydrate utilization transcriptional regulator
VEPDAVVDAEFGPSSCLASIRRLYAELTGAERRVADYLLGNPGRAMALAITELAQRSGVGVATVSRLCGKLGFAGYPEMKTALAVEMLSPEHAEPEAIHGEDDAAAVIRKTFALGARNMQSTAALLDHAAFSRAAEVIARARRVEFYAHGGITPPIAQIALHRFLILGVPCAAVSEPAQLAASATLLGPGDVAVALSNSGDVPSLASALTTARAAGATTVAVTNVVSSVVAEAAEVRLFTAARESWVWSDPVGSRIPMLGVIDALYGYVALLRYRAGRAVHRPVTRPGHPRRGDDARTRSIEVR